MNVPPGFELFLQRARQLLQSPSRLQSLLQRGTKALAEQGGRLGAVSDEARLLLDLLAAWRAGTYRDVSRNAVLAVAGAVLYFVVPLDTVPDFILGLGYLDDIAVIGYVARVWRDELDKFRQWRQAREATERSGIAAVESTGSPDALPGVGASRTRPREMEEKT